MARYALFSIGADDGVFWMVLVGILLHGICYDFFFVTGQIYTDRVAPKQIRGQAQGMLVLFTLGLGMLIGAQVGGRVEAAYTADNAKEIQADADAVAATMSDLQTEVDGLYGRKADDSWLSKQMKFFFPKSLSEAESKQVAALKTEIDDLRAERGAILRKSVNWKQVWFWPAVAAGVIAVLFAILFRDDTPRTDPEDERPAEAE